MTDQCKAPNPRYMEEYEATNTVPRRGASGRQMRDHLTNRPLWDEVTTTGQRSTVLCNRLAGHPGPHSAYAFRITQPEEWSE